ncbi:MAG: SDR family oxidoreductase [Tardiphaga sp.]|nr:SDR family oxidoreductase [Tardiphaga sp.]
MTERVTLITGASSGIGAELAREFASHAHRVVLVARRADRLRALARDIVMAGGSAPIIIPCDLELPGACDQIASALVEAEVEVEYVVNNAGFGMFGRATDMDRARQLAMIELNVRVLTDLSLRFSDSLIRTKGGLLNISSIAGFLPGPGMAVYYASKAYVLSFTEALHQELGPLGVRVTALCPGPVPSEFQQRAGFEPGLDSAILNVSAADVARAGYRGLMAGKRIVLPGLGIRMVPLLLRLFPRGFIAGAVARLQLRRVS